MKVKTSIKAGGRDLNHSEAQGGLKVQTGIKAGATNHKEARGGLKVQTGIKAGIVCDGNNPCNHKEARGGLKVKTGIKAGAKKLYVGN